MSRQGQHKCFNCGAATDRLVKNICGCGLSGGPGRFPFVCAANAARSPTNPAEIVIVRAAPRVKVMAGT